MDLLRSKSLHMIRYQSSTQMSLKGFAPFAENLDQDNRWVVLGRLIPWDELAGIYYRGLSVDQGRPAVDARAVIGATIIKHKERLDDRGTIEAIQENPYMQWFCGLSAFSTEAIFDASLFVTLRKRMGPAVFDQMQEAILRSLPQRAPARPAKKGGKRKGGNGQGGDEQAPTHSGELKIDATVAPQNIAYPTDLGLLNTARECTEGLIDALSKHLALRVKPRTYRQGARKAYLQVIRKRKRTRKEIRKAIGKQLRYLRRNLASIGKLLDRSGASWPLTPALQHDLWVVQHVYVQQLQMYSERTHRVEHRIVSVHQPHVRPIVRGKATADVEFGAKLNVALCDGIAWVDHIGWEAHNESEWLIHHVERYKARHGYYPEAVNVDGIYGTRHNRAALKGLNIRFIGKPLGRPTAESLTAKAKVTKRKEMGQRNHIEAKFGQAKNAYGLDRIPARLQPTSESWIAAIFLVMNLVGLERRLSPLFDRICLLLAALLSPLGSRNTLGKPMSFAHSLHSSANRCFVTIHT